MRASGGVIMELLSFLLGVTMRGGHLRDECILRTCPLRSWAVMGQWGPQFSSVQSLSRVWLFATPFCSMPGFPVHHQLLGACSNSRPSSQWCHPTTSSSVIPFSSCLQSFPASGTFPTSQFFTSGSQNIGASVSVLQINIQDWFPLGFTGLISLQSKGLSRVFSNITVQKNQFFSAQLSLWSNSHIPTWLLEKP